MTVIEATSPGDAWVKVSKHLIANGVKVGDLTEELNVMTEITEFKSDDWFDPHFREVMGDDRIEGNYELETGFQIINCFKDKGLDYKEVEMVLVGNHAPFTWGKNADKAVHNSAVLEQIAQMALCWQH